MVVLNRWVAGGHGSLATRYFYISVARIIFFIIYFLKYICRYVF